ncbi:hypothetical protein D3C80_1821200 [compost metagenome]
MEGLAERLAIHGDFLGQFLIEVLATQALVQAGIDHPQEIQMGLWRGGEFFPVAVFFHSVLLAWMYMPAPSWLHSALAWC